MGKNAHFGLIDTFFFYLFSEWIVLQKFFSRLFYENPKPSKVQNFTNYELLTSPVKDDNDSLSSKDVEMVMDKLGFSCSQFEGEKGVNLAEFSSFFEENEPSLEEVKETFCVFDENKDGFIDAEELQRVFCVLGLREGLELENCKEMIACFDTNGDNRIDFHEFVKFMEDCLC